MKKTFKSQLRLYEVLQKMKVTNRELARRIGVSEQLIGRYVNERAYPSLQRLHEIANALEMKVKDLFEPLD